MDRESLSWPSKSVNAFCHKQWERLRHWQGRLPVGWQVVALAVLVVGGRYLWVCAHRPAHRMELADAYSINLFYGAPQADSKGKQITYVSTADPGFAVFLVDTTTGQRTNVREQNALGPWGSYFDLKVWPWATDDRTFVYSASNRFHFCEARTGKTKGELPMPVEVLTLAWLDGHSLVFIGRDEALYQVREQADGTWQVGKPFRPARAMASTENAPRENAAKAFDGAVTTKWYNNNRPLPWWLQYQFAEGVARTVVQYSLTSANDAPQRDPKDWEFQASNNGVNWFTLDTRREEAFAARQQTKTYWVSNQTAYPTYRLHILKQAGAAQNNMQLAEFALHAVNSAGQMEDLSLRQNAFTDAVSLCALSNDTIAWGSDGRLWRMNVNTNAPELLVDCRLSAGDSTELRSLDYAKSTGKFLLNGARAEKEFLYQFNPHDPTKGLEEIPTGAGVGGAAWLAGGRENHWIGRQNRTLLTQRGGAPEVPLALAWANVETMTVTAGGQRVFFLGTATNEPAAGLWQYDLATTQLQPVVAYAEHPSRYAKKIEPLRDFILTETDKYTIYLPSDYYEHPKRKRPLVIGDTDFGFAMRGAYGRMWAPAVAACNAFVIVVNRKDWFGGLDQWGDRVTTAMEELSARLPIDKDRMFLFAVSAETIYAGRFLAKNPARWRGIMFLNPSDLPDLSGLSSLQPMPKILVSVGELERREKQLKEFQQKALNAGVLVDLVVAPGEKHHLVGNAAQRQRTRAMIDFIFGD